MVNRDVARSGGYKSGDYTRRNGNRIGQQIATGRCKQPRQGDAVVIFQQSQQLKQQQLKQQQLKQQQLKQQQSQQQQCAGGMDDRIVDQVRSAARNRNERQCQVTNSVFFGATLDPSQMVRRRQQQQETNTSTLSVATSSTLLLPDLVTVDRYGSRRQDLRINESVLHIVPDSVGQYKRKNNNEEEKKSSSFLPSSKTKEKVLNRIPGSRQSGGGPSPRQLNKMPPTTTTASAEEIQRYRKKIGRIIKTLPQLSVQVLMRHKAVLNELGRLEVVQQPQLVLVEEYKEVLVSPLKLLLLRPTGDQERPMMPSSNMNFLMDNLDNKHHYVEPVRDRDKDWRELMWTSIAPSLKPQSGDNTGVLGRQLRQLNARISAANNGNLLEEEENKRGEEDLLQLNSKRDVLKTPAAQPLSKFSLDTSCSVSSLDDLFDQITAAERQTKVFVDGVLINKLLIIRRGKRFGEFGMVVSVFGMGIAGRVFMKKHRFPRHLRAEAYCSRLQQTFTLRIDLPDLERLVDDRPELLRAGHKQELCLKLLDMLWFDAIAFCLRVDKLIPPEGLEAQYRREKRSIAAEKRVQIMAKISKWAITGTFGDIDADDIADVGDQRRGKLWPRLQGLIFSVGRRLQGHYLVVTVHMQPRKPSTLVIVAYDPGSCLKFQILVSTRELAQLVRDRKDPDLWDMARCKDNCEKLVLEHLTLRVVGVNEMALALNGRLGLSGPGLQQSHIRKGVIQGTALRLAESMAALQLLATQVTDTSRRYSVVGGAPVINRRNGVFMANLKVPRRDIGHGALVYRELRNVLERKCLASVFFNPTHFLMQFYEVEKASTWTVKFLFSEFMIICKEHGPMLKSFQQHPVKNELATELCNIIIDHKIILPAYPERSTTERVAEVDDDFESVTSDNSDDSATSIPSISSSVSSSTQDVVHLPPVEINRQIYCRGHKLKDKRPKARASHVYCLVSMYHGPDWFYFQVFDRVLCKTIRFAFSEDETEVMMQEFKEMELLEREIQISVLANTLGLEQDDKTSQIVCRVMDDIYQADKTNTRMMRID